jgi:hypothetical protein
VGFISGIEDHFNIQKSPHIIYQPRTKENKSLDSTNRWKNKVGPMQHPVKIFKKLSKLGMRGIPQPDE